MTMMPAKCSKTRRTVSPPSKEYLDYTVQLAVFLRVSKNDLRNLDPRKSSLEKNAGRRCKCRDRLLSALATLERSHNLSALLNPNRIEDSYDSMYKRS